MRRVLAFFLFLLMVMPIRAPFADGDQNNDPSDGTTIPGSDEEQPEPTKGTDRFEVLTDEELRRQIQDTYQAAKQLTNRSSFQGYCGSYVANQLVVLGINTSLLIANGKNSYDLYRDMETTTGGYVVTAYSARKYSLSDALSAIMAQYSAPCNILVGFQKGTSKAGKKYGHVLLIHGIRDGKIYFSDSCSRRVDGRQYQEGEPIVCSLASFVYLYSKYKLDGVVHFYKEEAPFRLPNIKGMNVPSSKKYVAFAID